METLSDVPYKNKDLGKGELTLWWYVIISDSKLLQAKSDILPLTMGRHTHSWGKTCSLVAGGVDFGFELNIDVMQPFWIYFDNCEQKTENY